MSNTVIDWQLAMVSTFGNLEDVDISITGDGITNTYTAVHLPSDTVATICHPRRLIRTAHDQEVQMIRAMDKLKALIDE